MRSQSLPSDGQRQTFWVVDAEIPDELTPESLVDLSNSSIIDSYDAVCHVYGDTLVSVSRPALKSWYAVREDGVWLVGENDRTMQRSFSFGLLHIPAEPAGSQTATDSVRTWVNSGAERLSFAQGTLTATEGCSFVFATGDTVKTNRLFESSATETFAPDGGEEETRVVNTRRWYCASLAFPVVQETLAQGKDGSFYAVTVCPPSEQPCAATTAAKSRAYSPSSSKGSGEDGEQLSVTVEGESLESILADSPQSLRIRICDTLGRVLRTAESASLPVEGLSPGCYILEVDKDGKKHSAKIWISNSKQP